MRAPNRAKQTLAANFATLKQTAMGNGEAMVGLRELERDAQASRDIYQAFLVRARETGAQEQVDTKNIRVLSKADLPQKRSLAAAEPPGGARRDDARRRRRNRHRPGSAVRRKPHAAAALARHRAQGGSGVGMEGTRRNRRSRCLPSCRPAMFRSPWRRSTIRPRLSAKKCAKSTMKCGPAMLRAAIQVSSSLPPTMRTTLRWWRSRSRRSPRRRSACS